MYILSLGYFLVIGRFFYSKAETFATLDEIFLF